MPTPATTATPIATTMPWVVISHPSPTMARGQIYTLRGAGGGRTGRSAPLGLRRSSLLSPTSFKVSILSFLQS